MVGAENSVREELKQIADPDVQASLANVTTPSEDDGKLPKSPKTSEVLGEATSAGSRFRILRPHARGGLGGSLFRPR